MSSLDEVKVVGVYDSPVGQTSLDLMHQIKEEETAIQYHYKELATTMQVVDKLNKQIQETQLIASNHRAKMLSAEARQKTAMEELQEELIEDLLELAPKQPDSIDLAAQELGRQV